MPTEPFRPSAFEAALLLLRLRESRDQEKEKTKDKNRAEKEPKRTTRFRVSELTLKRICGRPRLHPEFLVEMQDWLLRVGWAFFFADRSYGMIKLEAVESWTRLGSKRIADELAAVAEGDFDFAVLRYLADTDLPAEDD